MSILLVDITYQTIDVSSHFFKSLAKQFLLVFIGKVGAKDHQRFQASYATILKARMTALKKRERKDKKKAAESDKKEGVAKKVKRV